MGNPSEKVWAVHVIRLVLLIPGIGVCRHANGCSELEYVSFGSFLPSRDPDLS